MSALGAKLAAENILSDGVASRHLLPFQGPTPGHLDIKPRAGLPGLEK